MGFQAVGEGAREIALAVLEAVAEDEVVVGFTLSSLLCVTIQYDCQRHGVQSRPTEGFHSWNCPGVTID
jgi:hypothetical protein